MLCHLGIGPGPERGGGHSGGVDVFHFSLASRLSFPAEPRTPQGLLKGL